jgi:phospholipid/cholesterol/gamma-HCH transport system permease protein
MSSIERVRDPDRPRGPRVSADSGNHAVVLRGRWVLADVAPVAGALAEQLAEMAAAPGNADLLWDCHAIESLDSAGATLMWRAWGRALLARLKATPEHLAVFARLAAADSLPRLPDPPVSPLQKIMDLGSAASGFARHIVDFVALLGQVLLDFLHVLRHPGDLPRREIAANLFRAGVVAMPVTALVGFLIGVALSYLTALQLRQFGADVFIVNILGLSVVREIGPMLVAVLVAGRSGSSMTAQLGVMRVTEEIDALSAMGVSRSLRLVLPKVIALTIVLPALVLWTTAIAILGGMVAAQLQLQIDYGFFLQSLQRAVPVANLWIGLAKGVIFGFMIALVACHFGLRVRPNTESLAASTTASVVASITVVIIIDAIFAVTTRNIGLQFSQ